MKVITKKEALEFDRNGFKKTQENLYLETDIEELNNVIKKGYDTLLENGRITITLRLYTDSKILNEMYNKEGFLISYYPPHRSLIISLLK